MSKENPVLLNMLTLLTHYSQCDYLSIFKVMGGPLAGRITGEVVDGRLASGKAMPLQEAVRRALQGCLDQLKETECSMDAGLKVWVYEGLTYMIYSDSGPVNGGLRQD
ncbi:MAG: hypothetical protein ACOY30_10500 [Bacillota bacterium]